MPAQEIGGRLARCFAGLQRDVLHGRPEAVVKSQKPIFRLAKSACVGARLELTTWALCRAFVGWAQESMACCSK
jgi:hypothetical protein